MKFNRIILLLVFPLYFFSCKPVEKIPNYLENINDTAGHGEIKAPDLKIQKNDLLTIQIVSLSLNPERSDLPFNQPTIGNAGAPGYLVDNNGDILHHRLGLIHAAGLTKNELAAEIKKRLTVPVELLSDPTVVIRITNFKVTVLGQVNREGEIKAAGERLTIFEAIGLAGGITDFGKKTNLRVVREIDGKRETGIVNLASKEAFDSPFYYMMQNDMVFVESTNQKYKDAEQAKTMQKVSFAFTLVTVAATIASIFIRN